MKANRALPPSGYRTRLLSYECVAMLSLLIFALIYFFSEGTASDPTWFTGKIWENVPQMANGIVSSDGPTYVDAGNRLLELGEFDNLRTPVYPLIIALIHKVFGPGALYPVLFLLQYACFAASAFLLRRISLVFTGSPKATFWVVALYLLLPCYQAFNVMVLTESFSISGIILLVWLLVRRYPDCPKMADCVLAGLLMFVLLYLRPVFLYLFPVVFVYYIMVACRFKRRSLPALGAGTLVMLLVLASLKPYQNAITERYGIHSISSVTTYNNSFLAIEAVGLRPELAPTGFFREAVERVESEKLPTVKEQIDRLTEYTAGHSVEFEQYVKNLLAYSPKDLLKTLAVRAFGTVPKARVITVPFIPPYFAIDSLLMFGTYYLVLLTAIIFAAAYIVRYRRMPLLTLLMLMLVGGLLAASVVGAQDEWGRLTLPCFSLFMVLCARLCTMFALRRDALRRLA